MLICPVCREPLIDGGRALTCCHRHSYDRARDSYVNLLRTKHPGDTKAMLLARRRFLDAGYYAPIARAVADQALPRLIQRGGVVLDSGCGEGYYLGFLRDAITRHTDADVAYVGIDSSREATRLAARRYNAMTFAVSDIKDVIPVESGRVDVLLDVFAPRNIMEFTRILAPGGLIVVVIPHHDHLRQLRAAVPMIGIELDKVNKVLGDFESRVELIHRSEVVQTLSLDGPAARDLVAMSPSARHAMVAADSLPDQLDVTVAVDILTFRKSAESSD